MKCAVQVHVVASINSPERSDKLETQSPNKRKIDFEKLKQTENKLTETKIKCAKIS